MIRQLIIQRNGESVELEQKFKTLSENVKNVELIMTQSEEQIKTLHSTIESLTQAIKQGEEHTNVLDTQIVKIQQAITEEEENTKQLNGRITLHKQTIDTIETNINVLNSSLGGIDAAVKTIQQASEQGKIEPIANLITLLEGSTELQNLLNKLSLFEAGVKDTMKNRFSSVERSMRTLQDRVAEVEQETSHIRSNNVMQYTMTGIPVYSKPNGGTIVTRVQTTTDLKILEYNGQWHKVMVPGGITGWIKEDVQ